MPERSREVRYHFQVLRPGRSRQTVATTALSIGAALPRITRLMALAIKLDRLLQQRSDLDGVELARRGSISRSRLTQILNLLHLAPDIQERLLWLPPAAKGREVISEKTLRRLAAEYHWERQRERFEQLLSRARPSFAMACLVAKEHRRQKAIVCATRPPSNGMQYVRHFLLFAFRFSRGKICD